jgi:adhesin transport system outer membrane protein
MKKYYHVISLVAALLAPDITEAESSFPSLDLTVTCGMPMGHCKGEPTKATDNVKGASSITLRDLVEKTITANPEVQASYHTYLAAEQEHNAAIGGYLPRIDLISTGRAQQRMTQNFNNTQTPDLQTQFVLHQMLFDGFATRNTVNRLGHAARVRYYQIQSAMQNVAMDTVKAYMDTLKYRQFVDYASDNYAVHKQLFNLVEERAVSGVGRRVDLEQANARLNLAEANLLTQTTNLQNVEARYQRLTGELPQPSCRKLTFLSPMWNPLLPRH